MQESTVVIFVFAAFFIIFPLFWSAIVWLISRVSGWASLARQYPADGLIDGDVFRWCSARIRFLSSYSNCLTVTVSPAGIHMQPMLFFRIGHKPLFLPWSAIVDLDRHNSWPISSARLRIRDRGNDSPMTMVIYGRVLIESLLQTRSPS